MVASCILFLIQLFAECGRISHSVFTEPTARRSFPTNIFGDSDVILLRCLKPAHVESLHLRALQKGKKTRDFQQKCAHVEMKHSFQPHRFRVTLCLILFFTSCCLELCLHCSVGFSNLWERCALTGYQNL